jgi:putative membrane-bound dehydrogenase-like protein
MSTAFLRQASLSFVQWLVGLLSFAATVAWADDFPMPANSGAGSEALPLTAQQAAAGFRLPPGFKATVFAAEPDVQNPVAMTWDTRGRLWVAECYTYADSKTRYDLALRDRVLIFTDRDGDGRADERKVFCDNVQRLTSVEVGLGGVWLISLPRVLFIPDRNGDDVPDGPPEVVLDGFSINPENYHNVASGLKFGPDGWLYGRCGASSPGLMGPPGTPDEQREPIFGGLWRYHPTRKTFETLCHGTTNPWGHDWDQHGELFFTNTVTGHLFHMLPGAHYTRSATLTVNPRVYEPIDSHADHFHYDTGRSLRDHERNGSLGGGHAHCGALIYQGGQWPAEYRGRLLTLNLHGRRINVDRLEREGAGYVARHEADMAFAEDKWFRGIDLTTGPDSSVYVIDWSDTGECHEKDGVHRLSGRVYRISYGELKLGAADLTRLPVAELAALHRHPNEWFVRAARRELANRAAAGQDVTVATAILRRELDEADGDVVQRLRALWTLYTLDVLPRDRLVRLLDESNEHLRVWALRLLVDFWPLDTVYGAARATPKAIQPSLLPRLHTLAQSDSSGLVRLVLTSIVLRLPPAERPALAEKLATHAEDGGDHSLPKLLWYGLAPLAAEQPAELVPIAADGHFPLTRQWATRAIAEDPRTNAAVLDELLRQATSRSQAIKEDIVRGLAAGLAGRRKADAPSSWAAFAEAFNSAEGEVKELVRAVSIVFGDGLALEEVRRIALNDRLKMPERRAALETLIEAKPDDLRQVCERLLRVRFLNATAVKGLALFDDPALGEQLARSYRSFHPVERPALIEALITRPAFAAALLDEIEAGRIPATELSALQARQIRSYGDELLTASLSQVWGELRDSPQDKADAIARLKQEMTSERLATADVRQGRATFQKTCANCHKLYGTGGTIGPDLTGSGRHNLDYLLSNIIDPSAVVNKDYRMSIVRHTDGRVLNGLVTSQDEQRVVLQTDKEQVTLLRTDIDEIKLTPLSPMPDAILQPLAADQIRDLVAYLMSAGQVALPDDFAQ